MPLLVTLLMLVPVPLLRALARDRAIALARDREPHISILEAPSSSGSKIRLHQLYPGEWYLINVQQEIRDHALDQTPCQDAGRSLSSGACPSAGVRTVAARAVRRCRRASRESRFEAVEFNYRGGSRTNCTIPSHCDIQQVYNSLHPQGQRSASSFREPHIVSMHNEALED